MLKLFYPLSLTFQYFQQKTYGGKFQRGVQMIRDGVKVGVEFCVRGWFWRQRLRDVYLSVEFRDFFVFEGWVTFFFNIKVI